MLGSSAIQNFCYYHGTNYSYTVTTSVQLNISNPRGGGRTNSKPICF